MHKAWNFESGAFKILNARFWPFVGNIRGQKECLKAKRAHMVMRQPYIYIYIYQSINLSIYLSIYLSIFSFFFFLSLSLSFSLFHFKQALVPLSLSLSLFVSPFLSVSFLFCISLCLRGPKCRHRIRLSLKCRRVLHLYMSIPDSHPPVPCALCFPCTVARRL